MGTIHDVYDSDTRFIINPITRAVKNESSKKTTLIQHDHNSERFSFEIDRYIEGHDMSLCNKVEINYINVDSANKEQKNEGLYPVEDLQISNENEEKVVFSWLISEQATMYAGLLSFTIMFRCMENGETKYRWSTAINKDISVSDGIDNGNVIAEEYADILAQWEKDLFNAEDSAIKNIEAKATSTMAAMNEFSNNTYNSFKNNVDGKMASMTQHASDTYADFNNDVNEKAAETIESIPEDYSTLDFEVKNMRDASENLVKFAPMTEKIVGGGVSVWVEDNAICLNGTCSSYTVLNNIFKSLNRLIDGKYYFYNIVASGTIVGTVQAAFSVRNSAGNQIVAQNIPLKTLETQKNTFTVSDVKDIAFVIPIGLEFNDVKIRFWITKESCLGYCDPDNVSLSPMVKVLENNLPNEYKDMKDVLFGLGVSENYTTVDCNILKDVYYYNWESTSAYLNFKAIRIDVAPNEKYHIKCSRIGSVPFYMIYTAEGLPIAGLGETWIANAETYEGVIRIPSGGAILIVHAYGSDIVLEKFSDVSFDIEKEIEDTIGNLLLSNGNLAFVKKAYEKGICNEQIKNDYSWEAPEKLYVSFTFDDSNADISDIQTLFESKGVPCCYATIPSKLENITNSGETVKEVLQRAVANGGEVLAHWGSPLTSESTDEDYENVYVGAKKTLFDAGFEVNGIITAGGTNYNTQDFVKCVEKARPYYKFGDLTSYTNQRVEQYYNMRKYLVTDTETNREQIVDFVSNGQLFYDGNVNAPFGKPNWLILASHGTSDGVTTDILSDLIDYILEQPNVEIVTMSTAFEAGRSSKLEKRIKALESK